MATGLLKNSALMILPESAPGVIGVSYPYDRKYTIEAIEGVEFNDNYDTVERSVVRKSFSTYAPLRGLENTSLTIPMELHGSGSVGTDMESSLLYECAFGYKLVGGNGTTDSVASAVAGPGTLKDITFTLNSGEGANFTVGRVVSVFNGSTLRGTGRIISISGDTLTVRSRDDWSAEVHVGDAVTEGVIYSLCDASGDVGSLKTFAAAYFRGDLVLELFTGNIVTQLDINLSTGQIIQPQFNAEGMTCVYNPNGSDGTYNNSTTGTLSYDSELTGPIVARSVDLIAVDSEGNHFYMPVAEFNTTITNEVAKLEAVTEEGYWEVDRIKRNVAGNITTYYQGPDFQEAFKNEITYDISSVIGSVPGNMFALSGSKMKFSSYSFNVDNGIYQINADFSFEPTGKGDNEIFLQCF
jgi:hypothetical protein